MQLGKSFLVPLLCCSLFAASCSTALERKLSELDAAILTRESVHKGYEEKGKALERSLLFAPDDASRFDASEKLFRHFRYYQMDSALLYLNLMAEYGADSVQDNVSLLYTEILISMREYDRAQNLLNAVDTSVLNGKDKASFYHTYLLLCANMAVDEFLPREVRAEMLQQRHDARIKYISCGAIDPFEYVRRNAIQLYEDGKPEEAIPILENLYEECGEIHRKEDAAYSLANAHLAAGDKKMAMFWFAQSAIHSQLEPNRTYLSLYELAILLSEGRDLKRSSDYVMIAMKDALDCKYSPRIFNSARFHLSIASAVENKVKVEKYVLFAVLLCFAVLLALIFILYARTHRQARKLHVTHNLLKVANSIKEGYVFKYITLSAGYLAKMEDYRRELRRAMKSGDIESIRKIVRDPGFNEEEYQKFYAYFDETFLGIFPDFVEKVNDLLEPEWRFSLKKDGEFPTGVRILAAIRLGITDSGKIAQFLSCAPSSVYTHRCKIKKHALCNPELFESKIMEI